MRCSPTLKSGATLCIPISSTKILWMKPCLYRFLLCTRFPYNHNHKWDLSGTLPLSDTGFWGHWSDPILSAPGIVAVHTISTRKTLSALDEGRRHACSLPECVREGEGRRERKEGGGVGEGATEDRDKCPPWEERTQIKSSVCSLLLPRTLKNSPNPIPSQTKQLSITHSSHT